MEKRCIYLALFLVLFTASILTYVGFNVDLKSLTMDSGWDSDYDSGGSDWSYSSDYSSSYDYDSGVEVNLTLEETLGFFACPLLFIGISIICFREIRSEVFAFFSTSIIDVIIISLYFGIVSNLKYLFPGYDIDTITSIVSLVLIIVFLVIVIIWSIIYERKRKKYGPLFDYTECSDKVLEDIGVDDREKLKGDFYKIFVDVQNAWMNFKYDDLEKLCGEKLFNSFKSDLEVLKLNNGKNVMSDFEYKDSKIIKVSKKKDNILVKVVLRVSFFDYVINDKTKEVIRGNDYEKMDNTYLLVFSKKNKPSSNCPSCGADLVNNKRKKCPYCKSPIINNFVLYTKKIVK